MSKTFARSEFLKRFLKFIVAKYLRSEQHEIKEYSLATEVLGRTHTFDPKIDTIVRVQAHRLRSKLKEFYRTEGRNDQIRIDVPKGSYIPFISKIKNVESSLRPGVCKPGSKCRVAVLPFIDLGRSATADLTLVDAITETLIDDLFLTGRLEVITRIRDLGSKHRQRDVQDIGKRLKLDAVIEGSIQTSRKLLRVKARLVDANTRCVMWSTTFDITSGDRLAIQGQISDAIVPSVLALLSSPRSTMPGKMLL